MRTSQYLLSTLKDKPYDAKIISHQLMIRSGMIRQLSSGLYIWLPIGIRVIKKIKKIITKEMQKIKALEIHMPIVQPESLWKKSGRLNVYGEELLKFYDRRQHQFILGPTNEEVATDFVKKEIHSYKELPLIIYQIQTKFRDEIRPRFGVIRAREFIMKDAYSFHIDKDCLRKTYDIFYQSYINIFKKMQLNFCIVKANSGSMGGNFSHEFQAFSKNGEDEIAFSENKLYSSNMNTAQSMETINFLKNKNTIHTRQKIKNSQKSRIISHALTTPIKKQIKTILVKTKEHDTNLVAALLIRRDHELNLFKLENLAIFQKPLVFLNEKEIISLTGVSSKFVGPIGLKIPIVADISTINMKNFTIGANVDDQFFVNVNWNIDLPIPIVQDIRKVTKEDLSPNGEGYLNIKKSIEIGHIFQIDRKYSKSMQASVKLKNGKKENMYMGCYGIGITRTIAAIIEQNHDENGIIWPSVIAPFEVAILPININKSNKIKNISNFLYENFKNRKIDVIIDDRNERPGIMFNKIDLIGIPHQVIISENSVANQNVEYRRRKDKKFILININCIIDFISNQLKK
ncbi:proline--tRNA ligase [Buchnera aphidicola (Diuraphis noxia)]|uniref:Proline--tRNA ligase n=1 Tax=Buchnera aphidicola subsp. Diuraphis noxia TaxID=118101 RepID=A0A1B2H8F9_BUCDN|nr:proline--tRNA ligase [Buchnera aphidicola]ANZ22462.1 proline--tRNA ligase [Buchnera aphidicola (Diuraphis noxia)]